MAERECCRIAVLEALRSADLQFHAREAQLIDKARVEALRGLEIRLEHMNEFRAQLRTQAVGFATREMVEPLQSFRDKAIGVLLTFTALNGLLTALIVWALRK